MTCMVVLSPFFFFPSRGLYLQWALTPGTKNSRPGTSTVVSHIHSQMCREGNYYIIISRLHLNVKIVSCSLEPRDYLLLLFFSFLIRNTQFSQLYVWKRKWTTRASLLILGKRLKIIVTSMSLHYYLIALCFKEGTSFCYSCTFAWNLCTSLYSLVADYLP